MISMLRVHPSVTSKCCRTKLPCSVGNWNDGFTCPTCGKQYMLIQMYDKFWVEASSKLAKGAKR